MFPGEEYVLVRFLTRGSGPGMEAKTPPWFAVWRALEETEGPEALKWTVLRIVSAPEGSPRPVQFLEV
jgi:hypothetical protein